MQRFFDAVNKAVVVNQQPDKIVLVVDDDSLMRWALCEHLRLNNFTSIGLATAAEGYAQVLQLRERVCVLITDMVLPGGGGWQLVQSARCVVPELAVIFISGAIDEQVVTSACSHPRTGFLEKPFDLTRLTDLIRSLMSEKISSGKFASSDEIQPNQKAG
jgi:two-component system, cell cycle sensor histidine kinase and response regulator CckA